MRALTNFAAWWSETKGRQVETIFKRGIDRRFLRVRRWYRAVHPVAVDQELIAHAGEKT